MRHIVVQGAEFVAREETLYRVTDRKGRETYAWSPDGEGFFWYDSYEEAVEQHGDNNPVHDVDDITDF